MITVNYYLFIHRTRCNMQVQLSLKKLLRILNIKIQLVMKHLMINKLGMFIFVIMKKIIKKKAQSRLNQCFRARFSQIISISSRLIFRKRQGLTQKTKWYQTFLGYKGISLFFVMIIAVIFSFFWYPMQRHMFNKNVIKFLKNN